MRVRHRPQPREIPAAAPGARQIPAGIRGISPAPGLNRRIAAALAERQHGVVAAAQLRRRDVSDGWIRRAVAGGRLHQVHPGVLSVIPVTLLTPQARLAAAVLAGGRDAVLCGPTAAWWFGLLRQPPVLVHVAVTARRVPRAGIVWHRLALAADERTRHAAMPVTIPDRVPLDLAASLTAWELEGVLAELEYRCAIGPEAVARRLRRGYPGARRLRQALADHTPELAATRSELERAFARFLAERGFALPAFNQPMDTATVDAIYAREGVVFELDGVRGHSGERRILRDHRRDLHRRADGLMPVRYHYTQLTRPADQVLVEAELLRLGIPRSGVPARLRD